MPKADMVKAAVRLGKLREETLDALDQIPLRIEKAVIFMRTYQSNKTRKQATQLYIAIIDALQHILTWYQRQAGRQYP